MYNDSAEAIATLFGHEIRDSRSVETMRAEALAAARRADVILLAMGEASEMSGECASRVHIEMPDAQHDLMVELKKLGKPMILLHFAGRPTVLNWETENLDAILETWFSGSETRATQSPRSGRYRNGRKCLAERYRDPYSRRQSGGYV